MRLQTQEQEVAMTHPGSVKQLTQEIIENIENRVQNRHRMGLYGEPRLSFEITPVIMN